MSSRGSSKKHAHSLNDLAQFGFVLTADAGKPMPDSQRTLADGYGIGPVGAWQTIATPNAWLIHGDRRTGRSTQLYLRWIGGLAAQQKTPQMYSLVYAIFRHGDALRQVHQCLEAAVPGDVDHTLLERHFKRYAFSADDILDGRHRGGARDGWMVDGWLNLSPRVRDLILADHAPVIAYTL